MSPADDVGELSLESGELEPEEGECEQESVEDGFETHISTRVATPSGKLAGACRDGGSDGSDGRAMDEKDAAELREREDIAASLKELTRYISVADAMKNMEGVAKDLKSAIKKLEKLIRKIKKSKQEDVEMYPDLFAHSKRIIEGLSNINIICSSSGPGSLNAEMGQMLFRTAMNYRHDVFSASQKSELEAWVRGSNVLKVIVEEKERAKAAMKLSSMDVPKEDKVLASDQGQPLDRTASAQPQNMLPEEDEADAEAVPPPPPRPPLDMDPLPPQLDPPAMRSASSLSRGNPGPPKMKILVSSTPADIRKAARSDEHPPDHSSGPKRGFVRDDRAASPDGRSAKRHQRHHDYDRDGINGSYFRDRDRDGGGGYRERDDGGSRDGYRERDEGNGGWLRDGPFRIDDGRRDSGNYGRFRDRDPPPFTPSDRGRPEGFDSMLPPPIMPPAPDSPLDGDACLPRPPPLGSGDLNGGGRPRRSFHDGPLPSLSSASGAPSADHIPAADVSALLQRGRLCLIIDLDNVLLNTSRFTEIDPDTERQLQARLAAEATAKLHDHWLPELFRMDRLGIWVKLRPGVREFLRRCLDRFELWVYTSGTRPFAEAVVELIDPHGQLFSGRVIAQGNGVPDALSKILKTGLESRTAVSLILGDSSVSWMADRRNLFVVEQYLFFPSSRRKHGVLKGKSLLDINRDECPERGMLMNAINILERISTVVFMYLKQSQLVPQQPVDPKLQPWDVRCVLEEERRKVLMGVSVLFSHVIPQGQDPQLHPLWCLAEQFGAQCFTQCSESCTHVIANMKGTEKTSWAAQQGKPVVTTSWLECSCILWRRATEERFLAPS